MKANNTLKFENLDYPVKLYNDGMGFQHKSLSIPTNNSFTVYEIQKADLMSAISTSLGKNISLVSTGQTFAVQGSDIFQKQIDELKKENLLLKKEIEAKNTQLKELTDRILNADAKKIAAEVELDELKKEVDIKPIKTTK